MKSLDELQLFDHLARTRHFGRTSAECHVSQPTLSRRIRNLERELGVRLFDRDRRQVALTAEGIRFHAMASEMLAIWEGYRDAGIDQSEVTGTVSVFCTVTAAQSIVPDLLARFRAAHPGVNLALETGYAAEALEKLDDGAVDVTVAPLPPRPPKHLISRTIGRTPLVLVASRDLSLTLPRRPSAVWSRVPFVLPTSGLVRTLVDQWFRHLRVRPNIAAEAAGHEAILSLVTLGCGIGVVPELVAAGSPLMGRLQVVPTAVQPPHFDFAVCTNADHLVRRAVAAFWDTIAAEAAEG